MTSRSCWASSTPGSSPATPRWRSSCRPPSSRTGARWPTAASPPFARWSSTGGRRFGEASQLLEPDLKESYGGLRDATILKGVAASWVTDVPHNGYEDSVGFLLDVRDSLHRVTGTSGDRLLMQEQDAVAEDLVGVAEADALLRAVFDSARTIAYASDVTWHRVDRLTRNRQRVAFRPIRRRPAARLPLADGVIMQDGEVVLALEAKPSRDEGLMLRAAAAAAQAGLRLSPHTVDRLAAESVDPSTPLVARGARVVRVAPRLGAGDGGGLGGARPARADRPHRAGLGCRPLGAAAERPAPLHRGPAPRRDRRAGQRADPQRAAPRPPAHGRPAARHRQGAGRRPQCRRSGHRLRARRAHGVRCGRLRGDRRAGAPPPPARRHRDAA
jgi:hypothetical protein